MSKQTLAYIQISFAMIAIGSFVVVNKFIIKELPIFIASELRLLIACLILLPLFLYKGEKMPKLVKKDYIIFFLQSFIGVFLFSICTLYGLRKTTALDSGIIMSCTPAIMALISYFFLKEKLGIHKIGGILLTILGTLSINVFGQFLNFNENSHSLIGNILIFCAVIGEAVFFSFGKLISTSLRPLTITTIMSLTGAVLFLPLAMYQSLHFNFFTVSPLIWSLVLYTGIVITVLAVLLMNQGLEVVSAGTAAVFTALMPISTVVLSALILHEPLFWYHIFGMLLVMGGIFVITNSSSKSTVTSNEIFPKSRNENMSSDA
ncbi:Permease of the drug/metabolite transporter (DMT) superfamily [Bacillus sp. 491mf]|uniref:DMT family transporter n=1 Tax=Bacillus sp. 491mf TaxID=1761755 RepID=UPI0008EC5052|nr:DMT family transporter [Bacillus sp. 491mf]SFC60294.1 Permease of the drug/metabolite transporter (DMT) superfamily [Bacillus sp. 491mf]